MTVALIPYACGLGCPVTGCERGPDVLREKGLKERLAEAGIQAVWIEGLEPWTNSFVPPMGSPSRQTIVREHLQDVSDNVANAAGSRMLPISLGGDHSMAIGSVGGFARGTEGHGRIGMIWLDAHLDAHTPDTSHSKAIHGMPVAALLGYGDADIVSITGGKPAIAPEHLCMVGVRSYEPEEMAFLTKLGVRIILMEEIRQLGLTRALNEAIEIATTGTDYHYLTFDLDVMDAADAPAISIPEPNGLTRDETLKALEYLASRVEFHGIDIAEFNPKFDKDGQTFTLIADALAVLAKRHVGLHVV